MFATDRDLLVLEPNLFRDHSWIGQRVTRGTANVSGTQADITGIEVALATAGVGAGYVATIAGVSYEVVSVIDSDSFTLSRLRVLTSDPVLPPAPATAAEFFIATFRAQIALAHRQLLAMAGIDPDPPAGTTEVTEAAIVNDTELARLEALSALHLIFSAASAASGPNSALGQRAAMYQRRFALERQRVSVRLDLDSDGVADAARSLSSTTLGRG